MLFCSLSAWNPAPSYLVLCDKKVARFAVLKNSQVSPRGLLADPNIISPKLPWKKPIRLRLEERVDRQKEIILRGVSLHLGGRSKSLGSRCRGPDVKEELILIRPMRCRHVARTNNLNAVGLRFAKRSHPIALVILPRPGFLIATADEQKREGKSQEKSVGSREFKNQLHR